MQVIQPCPKWPMLRRRKFWKKTSVPRFWIRLLRLLLEVLRDRFDASSSSFSDTSKKLSSIHSRKWHGNGNVGEEVVGIDVWFGLALAASLPVLSLQCLRCGSLGFPPSFPSRICLSRSPSSTMSEVHRQIKSWSWSRFRNGLDDNWRLHPELDRSSCFPRIHPFTLDNVCVKRCCVLSTWASPICQVPRRRGLWNTVLSPQPSRYLHGSVVLSIEHDLEDLRIFVHNRAASLLAQSHWSEAFCSLSTILLASPCLWSVVSNKFPCTS